MKKMSKEAQMQKNGGDYVWHCHICDRNFYGARTKDKARKNANKHVQQSSHRGQRGIWDYGYIEGCKNN